MGDSKSEGKESGEQIIQFPRHQYQACALLQMRPVYCYCSFCLASILQSSCNMASLADVFWESESLCPILALQQWDKNKMFGFILEKKTCWDIVTGLT